MRFKKRWVHIKCIGIQKQHPNLTVTIYLKFKTEYLFSDYVYYIIIMK